MAGHILFNNLRDGDGIKEEQFFLVTIGEMEQTLLSEFKKHLSGKKSEYDIMALPDNYLEEHEIGNNYKAYAFKSIKCSEEAVWGGDCSVELHYKNDKEYSFYAVA